MNSNISLYRVCPKEKGGEGKGWDRMGRNEKERDWIEWEGMKRKGMG